MSVGPNFLHRVQYNHDAYEFVKCQGAWMIHKADDAPAHLHLLIYVRSVDRPRSPPFLRWVHEDTLTSFVSYVNGPVPLGY